MNADMKSLLRKLAHSQLFSPEEQLALQKLPIQIVRFGAGEALVRQGDSPTRSFLVLEGFICASKHTAEGRRQITSFYVPGDIPDLQSLHLGIMDIGFETITPCAVGFIPHEELRRVCADYPRITAALWRATLVDAAIFREWVTTVGQRNADARLSHVFCEIFLRLQVVGLTTGNSCALPMTQAELGDAVGITVVHVNRTLQKLRAEKLIAFKNKKLTILDWNRLAALADFDATYLHLDEAARGMAEI